LLSKNPPNSIDPVSHISAAFYIKSIQTKITNLKPNNKSKSHLTVSINNNSNRIELETITNNKSPNDLCSIVKEVLFLDNEARFNLKSTPYINLQQSTNSQIENINNIYMHQDKRSLEFKIKFEKGKNNI